MIVDKNFARFVVFSEDSLSLALQRISANQSRVAFVVAESGEVEGVITDGDIRRWLIGAGRVDLETPVSRVMNRSFIAVSADEDRSEIARRLNNQVIAVPIVDSNRRIVAVALQGSTDIWMGDRKIGQNEPSFIIAEIGNNHNGSLDLAYRLIDLAAEAGADCAKFQMRDMAAMYRKMEEKDEAKEDLGAQYTLDLLSRFQLSDSDLFKAFERCVDRGLVPLCTPWDISSLNKLNDYGIPGFKISSADFTNYDLIQAASALNKPLICSTGMTSELEIIKGVDLLKSTGCPFVLLHCNSTYPTPDKDVNLVYLNRLAELSNGVVGYSGHERGIAVPIAAVALGAKVVEKHFTTDRSMEGNDHKVSLLPDEFGEMVRHIRQVESALGEQGERAVSQGELMNREVLAKSLIAKVDIPSGVPVADDMIEVKSPGQGLQPNRRADLVGKRLSRPKAAGEFFYPSDIGEGQVKARPYNFKVSWGVPVRYHDLDTLRSMSNMDLLEIHLSYKDMELDFKEFIKDPIDLGLIVHAPELFAGDHILDLCSPDDAYREHSLKEMQRVIDLSRSLADCFKRTERPLIVTNVGGFSSNGPLQSSKRAEFYLRLEDSLAKLDNEGVEIIPQTMPPFPWHFGGQQFHNLFVDPEEINNFCVKNQMRVCLDVSHSKLACTHLSISLHRFMQLVAPHAAHYHLADAKGVDGEGLQVGDGDIDWVEAFSLIHQLSPQASFIPEIWQGHKNQGEGAWLALERLEAHAAKTAS